jgi:alpha-L-rhamnosidase
MSSLSRLGTTMKFVEDADWISPVEDKMNKNPLSRRVFLQNSLSAGFAGLHGARSLAMADLLLPAKAGHAEALISFRAARPIWPAGREKEMNLFVAFAAEIPYTSGEVVLQLAASTLYRVHVNGQFCASGAARAAHGYYRVDVLPLTPYLSLGTNTVVIEVSGANINSYWTLNQPSFLQAEIVNAGNILAATGRAKSFRATLLPQRLQKVQRYSFQRTFIEAYRLDPEHAQWKEGRWPRTRDVACHVFAAVPLLPRRAPYPAYDCHHPVKHVATGTMRLVADKRVLRPRFVANIGSKLLGFKESELEVSPFIDLQRYENTSTTKIDKSYQPGDVAQLRAGEFHLYDLGINFSGFPGASVTVKKAAKLYITFDETLTHGDVDFLRLECANLLYYELAPGIYDLESFEPYTMRFLKFILTEGELALRSIFLRTYENPDGMDASFASSDDGLNRLFLAGRETYKQNAVDLFTDCPSRERAGWLCDSNWTSRASLRLAGNCDVETAFIENYLMSKRFESLPRGMLPMCYPADHYDGQYIANWAMWFVLQLEEYLQRTGDRVMVDRWKPRLRELMEYFRKYQNADGLLEDLNGWVFVEWSEANKYTHGVNYPTNMVYAAMLACMGRLYNEPTQLKAAEDLREKIRRQSFDGHFFVDNALRHDGVLHTTQNRSETCQYYAFYFGTVTMESHAELWKTMCDLFGPARDAKHIHPEIAPSNALIGHPLRLELLSRDGRAAQLLREAREQLLYMADRTGTLWEHIDPRASLSHAFASHIVNVLYRDALGLYQVDIPQKQIELRFVETGLDWCEGSTPTPHGPITLRWTRVGQNIQYRCIVPDGYSVRATAGNNLTIEEAVGDPEAA